MSINDLDQSPKTEGKEINNTSNSVFGSENDEITARSIGQVFGMDNFSELEQYKDQIKDIADYARKQGKTDFMEMKWFVKEMEMKLGTPPMGEKRITNFARYIYLLNESNKIQSEIKSMGGIQ